MTKIGVFDSGLGGLTVLADIRLALPRADLFYIGDSANAPYGTKTQKEIITLSERVVDRLIEAGTEMIVVACNTATSAAEAALHAKYNLPIVGIEPALKSATEQIKRGKIIVLATKYTISHNRYLNLAKQVAKDQQIVSLAAPRLVELVELGKTDGGEVESHLKELVREISDVKGVVLGCTHFSHLKPAMRKFFGPDVKLFDGNDGVVRRVIELLPNANSGDGTTKIISTGGDAKTREAQRVFENYLEKTK
ncbi:MAG: glutamate racemase [Candidatus Nanosyncoccaceae bacterium]|jgi:glutamate racemase